MPNPELKNPSAISHGLAKKGVLAKATPAIRLPALSMLSGCHLKRRTKAPDTSKATPTADNMAPASVAA